MRSLVYIRRSESFNNSVLSFAKESLSSSNITTISEYFNGDLRINMNDKSSDYDYQIQDFIEKYINISEVIFRDRVLRNSSHSDCILLIRRATAQLLNIFEKNKFDALVTYPVDNYITDLMVKISHINNVKCYGVCSFFMGGYKRITLYGEHNPSRIVNTEEVTEAVNKLQKNFRSHMAPNRKKAIKGAIVRYLKYKARYPIFYLFFYKLLKRNEYDLMCTPFNTTVRRLSNFFVERYFTKETEIDYTKNSILVPMHYFPEATIEYWSGNLSQIEFEDMLHCKVNELSERYDQIILKEHPASLYDNPSGLYKKLLKNKKVVFIDPFVSTSSLLEKIEVVGCWTGTIGIEALVNGKKVEFFSNSQYYKQAMDLHPQIVKKNGTFTLIDNANVFVDEILKGCYLIER